jgi:hypothetical protein
VLILDNSSGPQKDFCPSGRNHKIKVIIADNTLVLNYKNNTLIRITNQQAYSAICLSFIKSYLKPADSFATVQQPY